MATSESLHTNPLPACRPSRGSSCVETRETAQSGRRGLDTERAQRGVGDEEGLGLTELRGRSRGGVHLEIPIVQRFPRHTALPTGARAGGWAPHYVVSSPRIALRSLVIMAWSEDFNIATNSRNRMIDPMANGKF